MPYEITMSSARVLAIPAAASIKLASSVTVDLFSAPHSLRVAEARQRELAGLIGGYCASRVGHAEIARIDDRAEVGVAEQRHGIARLVLQMRPRDAPSP